MNNLRALSVSLVLLAAAPVCAQEEKLTKAEAIEQMKSLVTTRLPRAQWSERDGKIAKWLKDVEAQQLDLGDRSYLKGVARYFERDYEAAGNVMIAYLDKNRSIPDKEMKVIVGRVLLNQVRMVVQAGDIKKARKVATHALVLYEPRMTVYSLVASNLKTEGSDKAIAYLNEILAEALRDPKLTDTDRQSLLTRLYAGRRAAGAARPAARLRPARGARPATRGKRSTAPKPLGAIVSKDLDGNAINLASFKGSVVLVDFWATWCRPCLKEMPHVVAAKKEFGKQGFRVIGISLDKEPGQKRGGEILKPDADSETTKKIRAMMKGLEMDWPVIYEGGGWETRLAKANAVRSIPATYLLDRTGKVRYTNLRGKMLAEKVKELLEEKPAGKVQGKRKIR